MFDTRKELFDKAQINSLIGRDISEVTKILGYWWVLESQSLSHYYFRRIGVGGLSFTHRGNGMITDSTAIIPFEKLGY